jgi:predicted neutral ceramidase superfamily lipid hydrolase
VYLVFAFLVHAPGKITLTLLIPTFVFGVLGVLGGSVLDLIPALFLSACSAVQM